MVKWFNDLNIKSKLLLSFSIVAFIAAMIGFMGYRGVADLAERQDYLATNSLNGIKNLGEISNRINQIVVGERGLINDRFMESSVRQAQYRFIKDGWRLLNEAKINYELIPESGEIRSGWNEFIPNFESWKKTNEELLGISGEIDNLISAGEALDSPRLQELKQKAIDKYFEGRTYYLQANKLLNVLIDVHSAEAARLDKETDAQVSLSISLLAGLTILGFLAAIGLGIFISRMINNPVKKVLFMAEELQKGHIKARAGVDTNDELGRMAKALDKFALQVDVSLIGTLNKIAEGEVSFTVPFYDEKDEIAPVLNRLTSTVREVINETRQLTEAAVEGNLSTRGNAEKFNGGFREIVDGINKTMDAAILPVKEGSDVLAQMAKGDLTVRVKGEYKGDHQIIKTSINQLADSMSRAIMEVGMAVDATASAANQISSSSEEMAAGASEQTQQVNEIAGAVEEMTRTIFANSQNTTSAAENSKLSNQSAKEGTLKVEETQKGMKKIVDATNQTAEKIAFLAKKTDEIGEITQVIDDIADQTNLLALNAAIEAARAGEQGRGFAVVADEVRKLAERTTKATKEIAQTIKAIQAEAREADSSMASAGRAVEEGMRMTDEVEEVLKLIYSSNEKSSDLITQVAASSEEQSATAEQISRNIDGISGITQQSAAGAEQIARAAEDLSRLTHDLQGLVNRFKLDYNAGTNFQKDRIAGNKYKAVLN